MIRLRDEKERCEKDDGVLNILADYGLVGVCRGGGPRAYRTGEADGTDASSLDSRRRDAGRPSGRRPGSSCGPLCISYFDVANGTQVARLSFY